MLIYGENTYNAYKKLQYIQTVTLKIFLSYKTVRTNFQTSAQECFKILAILTF